MTLLEADAPARLNGAHAPPPLPPAEAPLAAAVPAPPPAPRSLTAFDGKTRRLFTAAEYDTLVARARHEIAETTRSQGDIARELDILPGTLGKWKLRLGWQRPEGAPVKSESFRPRTLSHLTAEARRTRMVQRLYRVFDRQTCDLEARAAAALGTTDEKDARTLSVLAKVLETLIALDRDDGASTDTPEPAEREQSQAEFVERIRRWAEGGEGLAEG